MSSKTAGVSHNCAGNGLRFEGEKSDFEGKCLIQLPCVTICLLFMGQDQKFKAVFLVAGGFSWNLLFQTSRVFGCLCVIRCCQVSK